MSFEHDEQCEADKGYHWCHCADRSIADIEAKLAEAQAREKWFELSGESWIRIARCYEGSGKEYYGLTLCSQQTEPMIKGATVAEAISKALKGVK